MIHDSCCTCYDFNPIHMQKCWCTGTTCDTLIPLSNYPRASLDSCQFFNSNGAETVINFGRIFSSIVETNFPSPSVREIVVDGVRCTNALFPGDTYTFTIAKRTRFGSMPTFVLMTNVCTVHLLNFSFKPV